MRIDPEYLENRLGHWSATGRFSIGEDDWPEFDKRVALFQELVITEERVFTFGSNDTVLFESRPMWINATEQENALHLEMDDGDTAGQDVFLSNTFLYEYGVHRPRVVHEDGTELDVREAEDESGFWIDVPHFSGVTIYVDPDFALERQLGVTQQYQGELVWNQTSGDLYAGIGDKLVKYHFLIEQAWFNANMPNIGLRTHTWNEELYEGKKYYMVSLPADETPVTLNFMEYRPVDDWVFTMGNPESIHLEYTNESDPDNFPAKIRVHDGAHGKYVELQGEAGHSMAVSGGWLDSWIDEKPVFETVQNGSWAPAMKEPRLDGGAFLANATDLRIWDMATGPLVPPEYDMQAGSVVSTTDGCAIRHFAVLENSTVSQEMPACISSNTLLGLIDSLDGFEWRYDPDVAGTPSVARLCSFLMGTDSSGQVHGVGAPCMEYSGTDTPASPFLVETCAQVEWSARSEAAFCGGGVTRYQAAGMDLGVDNETASLMVDVLLGNEEAARHMNDVFANETIRTEWAWIEEVEGFLKSLRLDRECLDGSSLLTIGRSTPATACDGPLGEYVDGNDTVVVDPDAVEAAWDVLYQDKPCSPDQHAFALMGQNSTSICGTQPPLVYDDLNATLQQVDWQQECPDRGFLLVGFGENASANRVCGVSAPDPDESLDRVLSNPGNLNVCFRDEEETGDYRPGDPVYLAFAPCTGSSAENDLRLAHEAFPPGTKIASADNDFDLAYSAFAVDPAFVYNDGDGSMDPGAGDSYYLCVSSSSCNATGVEAGWIRLSGYETEAPGSVVELGDSDEGLSVTQEKLSVSLSDRFRYWDEDQNQVFGNQDVLYWALTGTVVNPSVGHMRMGDLVNTTGFGEILQPGMEDVVTATWHGLRTWEACSGEPVVVLDPTGALPDRVCRQSTAGLQDSLAVLFDHVMNWTSDAGVCGVGESPLIMMDPLLAEPGIVCGHVDVSEDQEWLDAWADWKEMNPCGGEVPFLDQGRMAVQGPAGHTYRFCGIEFDDVGGSLAVFGSHTPDVCNGGDDLMAMGQDNVLTVCGVGIPLPGNDMFDVENPCGDQLANLPGSLPPENGQLKWCGVSIPDLMTLIEELLENAPNECQAIGSMLMSHGGLVELCGVHIPEDPDDYLWGLVKEILDRSPCDPEEFLFLGMSDGVEFTVCGEKIGVDPDINPGNPCSDPDLDCSGPGGGPLCGPDSPEPDGPLCVTYKLDDEPPVKTFLGMPAIFGSTSDVQAIGWFVGAPLITGFDSEQGLEASGVAGSYTVYHETEESFTLSVEFQGTSLSMEVSERLDDGIPYWSALAGHFVLGQGIGVDGVVNFTGDFIFAHRGAESVTSEVVIGESMLAVEVADVQSNGRIWYAGILGQSSTGSSSGGPGTESIIGDSLDIGIDWLNHARVDLTVELALAEEIDVSVVRMPHLLRDGSIVLSEQSGATIVDLHWPGEEQIVSIHATMGGTPINVQSPPMSFIVTILLDLLNSEDTGWSKLEASMRGVETETEGLLGRSGGTQAADTGRMDVDITIEGAFLEFNGMSHNIDLLFHIELGQPEKVFPGLKLLLKDPTKIESTLIGVVDKILLATEEDRLSVTIEGLTLADVDTERDGADFRILTNRQGRVIVDFDEAKPKKLVVEAPCVRLTGDFELFASEEKDSGSGWKGYRNRTWGGGYFDLLDRCGEGYWDYSLQQGGVKVVEVKGWGDFSFELDVTSHDYISSAEDDESGMETNIDLDAVLDEGTVRMKLGPLLGKARSDGTFKTDMLLDAEEIQDLSIFYDGKSGTNWRGNGFGVTEPLNDVRLGWRITSTGSFDFEIFHDTTSLVDGSSRISAFVTPDPPDEEDDVVFQRTGVFMGICSGANFNLAWSGETKERCDGRLKFTRIGES